MKSYAILLAGIFLLASFNTHALEPMIEVGPLYNFYTGDVDSNVAGVKLNLGVKDRPLYVWSSYEQDLNPTVNGTSMGDVSILGVGLGVRKNWDKFSIFIEGGYGMVDYSPDQNAIDNTAYDYLVANHAAGTRLIPTKCPEPECYVSTNDYDNGWMGRVGAGYDIMDHVRLTAAYRWMEAEHYIAIWDEERYANDKGYWHEPKTQDFGAFELGVMFTW
jgi:opacity protein-like surface antigen